MMATPSCCAGDDRKAAIVNDGVVGTRGSRQTPHTS
jgi:hypothetical protein